MRAVACIEQFAFEIHVINWNFTQENAHHIHSVRNYVKNPCDICILDHACQILQQAVKTGPLLVFSEL